MEIPNQNNIETGDLSPETPKEPTPETQLAAEIEEVTSTEEDLSVEESIVPESTIKTISLIGRARDALRRTWGYFLVASILTGPVQYYVSSQEDAKTARVSKDLGGIQIKNLQSLYMVPRNTKRQ